MKTIQPVTVEDIAHIYLPPADSHKGQNGKLLIIGGSHLFHAASLWSLTVASRIVDLVHYCSTPENNAIVERAKEEFRNGIVVQRSHVEEYVQEDDCILIGPGMTRDEETKELTDRLLRKYPEKQWVIDAGALQMMEISLIPPHAILTPHHMEFEGLVKKADPAWIVNENLDVDGSCRTLSFPPVLPANRSLDQDDPGNTRRSALSGTLPRTPPVHGKDTNEKSHNIIRPAHSKEINTIQQIKKLAILYNCIILLKGKTDIVCSETKCRSVEGGNAGMTKGGTGDVLAGLIASLATKNDPFLATIAGSFINKKAGESLYTTVGPFFHATDLADEIPKVMRQLYIR